MAIKIYADRLCKEPVDSIRWDSYLLIKLVTGEEKKLLNTVKAGQTITATVYLRNESKYAYAITELKSPDKRLSISVEQGWLEPNAVTKLMITFVVPEKVTPKEMIKAKELEIEGHYHIINN